MPQLNEFPVITIPIAFRCTQIPGQPGGIKHSLVSTASETIINKTGDVRGKVSGVAGGGIEVKLADGKVFYAHPVDLYRAVFVSQFPEAKVEPIIVEDVKDPLKTTIMVEKVDNKQKKRKGHTTSPDNNLGKILPDVSY